MAPQAIHATNNKGTCSNLVAYWTVVFCLFSKGFLASGVAVKVCTAAPQCPVCIFAFLAFPQGCPNARRKRGRGRNFVLLETRLTASMSKMLNSSISCQSN